MKVLFFIVLSFAGFSCFSQTLTNDKVNILSTGTYNVNAVIYKPANYNPGKAYPLVLFFHGMNEAGTDVNLLYNTGLPQVLKEGYQPPFDFIMIAPQRFSYSVDPAWLPGILKDAESRFLIDTTRIYLTGLSAGGWGIYGSQLNISPEFAKKIAAIVINSGATQDAKTNNMNWWAAAKTPVWATVGGEDIGYKDQAINMVSSINSEGEQLATLTIRDGVGHEGWNEVYNGTVKNKGLDMWQWLYQYKREEKQNVILPTHFKSVRASRINDHQLKVEFEVTEVDAKEFWITLSYNGKDFKRLVKINPDPVHPNKTYSVLLNLK
jgi:hypothetical protein